MVDVQVSKNHLRGEKVAGPTYGKGERTTFSVPEEVRLHTVTLTRKSRSTVLRGHPIPEREGSGKIPGSTGPLQCVGGEGFRPRRLETPEEDRY